MSSRPLVPLLFATVAAALLTGCSGATSPSPPKPSIDPYSFENEDAFAQGEHPCDELELWYDSNPRDDNENIARQYWDTCDKLPPSVRTGLVEAWDPDDMFIAYLQEEFPAANHGEDSKRVIPVIKLMCTQADEGATFTELVSTMASEGETLEEAEELTRQLFAGAALAYCPEHSMLLDDVLEVPAGTPQEQALALMDELKSAYPKVGDVPTSVVIENAELMCSSISSSSIDEISVVWASSLLNSNLALANNIGQLTEIAGVAVGASVRNFCPDKTALIS